MSTPRAARFLACATFAGFAISSFAHAQAPQYDLAYLGTLPGTTETYPSAVNDHGLVVGIGASVPNSLPTPFYASAAQAPTALPFLIGDIGAYAVAVNNAGVIVGASRSASFTFTAIVWTPSPSGYVLSTLPPTVSGDQPTWAYGLNEVGDIVGELSNGHGFAWSASAGTVDLSTLGFEGIARSINESRQVVGGHDRIDLDTALLETGTLGLATWSLTFINDAGVAAYEGTLTQPPLGTVNVGGTYEFGVGPTGYAFGFPGFVPGLDYATDVPYTTSLGSPSGSSLIHYDEIGNFTLASLVDAASPGWGFDYLPGFGMSANGLLVVWGYHQGLGVSGPVLLTPQRFHAILEGAPGATGLPVLTGEGTLQGGSPVKFRLSRAAASAPVGVIAGLSRTDAPFYGGLLVPTPTLVLTGLSTDASGKLTLATTWPNGLPSGTTLYLQEWILDANAPFGIAGSNALECVVP